MFRIHALPSETFATLIGLDAEVGESLLLVHLPHHAVDSPDRASGPVFVREGAIESIPAPGEIPPMLRSGLMSVRGYSKEGRDLLKAQVTEGTGLADTIGAMFEDSDIEDLHLHIARPGCYAAPVTRA